MNRSLLRYAFLITTICAMTMTHASADPATPQKKPIRIGMIGLDTSHVKAFTTAIQGPKANPELSGVRVVAGYPGGSADIPSSIDRIPMFVEELKKLDVEIVDSIDELLKKVDVVMLESVDGRPHLAQARPVIAAGKPLFVDKPAAASLADATEIFRLAKEANVPCFSSSMLRFSPATQAMRNDPKVGEVLGCVAYSPCSLEEHHPDLYFYGIHAVETLYTIMGPGCVNVSRVHTPDTDVVTGVWRDGRVGSIYGQRKAKADFGALVFGSKGTALTGPRSGYEPLLAEVVKFFETGKPPVPADETLEILAFMDAADESKRLDGAQVTLESMFERAKSKGTQAASIEGPKR